MALGNARSGDIEPAARSVNSVTKLRASDGSMVGTYPVGTRPQWVAFDGTNMWVTNGTDNTISRL